jgi:tetratricopeptide (TPR) repeat protein
MSSRLAGLSAGAQQQVIVTAQALDAGRVDEAERALAPLLARDGGHAEVLRLSAGIFSLRGRHRDAVAAIARALAQRPNDAMYHNTAATVLAESGDFDAAIAALRQASALQPDLAAAWYNLGILLTRCVRYDEAAAALRRAVELSPDHVLARAQLADLLRMAGDGAAAVAQYRALLRERPWSGMAWWGLADMKTLALDAADGAAMRAALSDARASDDDRIATGFALARALDEQGRYAESLDALGAANVRALARRRWNAPAFRALIDANAAAFDAPHARATDAALGRDVIFVVGLPRSGTTLVEQILASHSQVSGAGELPDLGLTLGEESRRLGAPFPRWAGVLGASDWQRLGERYLARTAFWRRERPISVDKMPANWVYIDAIRAMLPGAHIVICRRDPLETCLSCYRQHFAGNDYTRTFEDLGAYWHDFDRSARRAAARDPAHVREHVYEALQREPEREIRTLLEFCGLPFEAACLDFHRTQRSVGSPSAMQVREPLKRDTARADRYGALLDPLRRALGLAPFGGAAR